MKTEVSTTTALQFVLVVFMSITASYVFTRVIEIAHGPPQTTLQLFFVLVLAIGVSIGTITVVAVSKTTGSVFFILLLIFLCPAILAESRVSVVLNMRPESNSFRYEIYAAVIAVVGGYFYLRHLSLSNQMRSELLARGGRKEDLDQAAKWGGYITGLVVLGAIAMISLLTLGSPILANVFQSSQITWVPFYIFVSLGVVIGVIVMFVLYSYQRRISEKLQIPVNQSKNSKGGSRGKEGVRGQLSILEERLREFIERGKP